VAPLTRDGEKTVRHNQKYHKWYKKLDLCLKGNSTHLHLAFHC